MRQPVCIFDINNEEVNYAKAGVNGHPLEIVPSQYEGAQCLVMDIHGTDITLAFIEQPEGGFKVVVVDEVPSDHVGGHPFEEFAEELFNDENISTEGLD